MNSRLTARVALPAVLLAGGILTLTQCRPAVTAREATPSIVGRWALIASMIDGEDVTTGGVTQRGALRVYTFNSDHSFAITLGDSVTETGTWSSDSTTSPKTFDHTWHTATGLGPNVPGIYELGGDVLKISLLPPTSPARPTRFETKAGNGSRIYIFRRVTE